MISRIIQQDRVLTSVNRHMHSGRQLSGLSLASINEWVKRNSDIDLASVSQLLTKVSRKIGALHDRSNAPVHGAAADDLDAFVEMIEEEMAKKRIKSGELNRIP